MIHRRAVRALLITGEREVLLMRIRSPHGGDCFWIAPGGGVEGDETAEATLQRELAEELGLIISSPGPQYGGGTTPSTGAAGGFPRKRNTGSFTRIASRR
ncbi:8-oxo-dGTP pyrophosphatase MutT (NUDIX family) [Bradyrhizobium sp. USDA 4516]|uniref:NUDIX domain-containing protein n=1 Tax=Bradyrhizobium pachyrhizi TaxID=280333 RepID=UPI000A898502|nr:NUDIX domain-containing protein [Bradyrhizobium pachyrhizi]